ncbi:Tim44/TimA family putative adaptor protein [Roseiterribacter gracilis]|uniref:Tim44/TimA family putative adaptor protein n=1 Tax=Roseiterribacter gracilis TaxID=2812848 RepID=UPI003B43999C
MIFAAIAVFLVLRLRAVLGRRTGEEQPRANPFATPDPAFVDRAPVAAPTQLGPVAAAPSDLPLSLEARVQNLRVADPSFDEKHFLAGAKTAFQMIVQAFAAGDLGTLKTLLGPSLYNDFSAAVEARNRSGHTLLTELRGTVDADLEDARVINGQTQVDIRFVSQQIHAVRDASGAIVEGDTTQPIEIIDLWTFARDPRSKDPNWQLVATDQPN